MMENKFTPRAEESLRLAQEAAEEMKPRLCGQRAPAAGPDA